MSFKILDLKQPHQKAASGIGKSLDMGQNRLIPIVPILVNAQQILVVCGC